MNENSYSAAGGPIGHLSGTAAVKASAPIRIRISLSLNCGVDTA